MSHVINGISDPYILSHSPAGTNSVYICVDIGQWPLVLGWLHLAFSLIKRASRCAPLCDSLNQTNRVKAVTEDNGFADRIYIFGVYTRARQDHFACSTHQIWTAHICNERVSFVLFGHYSLGNRVDYCFALGFGRIPYMWKVANVPCFIVFVKECMWCELDEVIDGTRFD